MARNFASASSQYLSRAGAVLTATPFTFALWWRPTNIANYALMSLDDGGSNMFYLYMQGTGEIAAFANAPQSTTAGQCSAGVWAHAGAVFASSTSRTAYLNGVAATTNTTSNTPTGINGTRIGHTGGSYCNGDIAEIGIWNIALATGDLVMLALGVSPLLVRPDALVAYYPLFGQYSPEIDLRGANDLTLNAAPVAAAHPRVLYAAGPPIFRMAAAAAAGQQGRMFAVF